MLINLLCSESRTEGGLCLADKSFHLLFEKVVCFTPGVTHSYYLEKGVCGLLSF